MQEPKVTSHNSSKSSTTQWPTWRQRGNKTKRPLVWKLRSFSWQIATSLTKIKHQAWHWQCKYLLQWSPAGQEGITEPLGSATHPGHPHSAIHTGWRLPRCAMAGRKKHLGFFLEISSSCLTPSFLLTAHQDWRAESSRDLSSLNFYSCFCLWTHFYFQIELRCYKAQQRHPTAESSTGLMEKQQLGGLYPNDSGEKGG